MQAQTTQAGKVVKELAEGDVIRVPQYKNALKVNHTGELHGEPNAFIGLEFLNRDGAGKSLIVNRHSGRVYLTAGTTDKGEVKTIKRVA